MSVFQACNEEKSHVLLWTRNGKESEVSGDQEFVLKTEKFRPSVAYQAG